MKRITIITLAMVMVMSLSGMSHGATRWDNEGITISPQVLVLEYSGTRITVHTNIPARDVIMSSVYIDINDSGPIEPCSIYADLRGFLVAKFTVEEVRPFVAPPSADMSLRGFYLSGEELSAAGSVVIK